MSLLIVNADDFGLNEAANKGIIECHLAGSVTSTTLMANAPALLPAVELARTNPDLGVGLHFNLTWGKPVSPPEIVAELVDDNGAFLGRDILGRRSLLGRIPREQVEIELFAQFQRLLELGVSPTHVDSHQHVHAFAPIFTAVAALCLGRRLPMRVPWVSRESGASLRRRMRRIVLSHLLARSTVQWANRIQWNDALCSVFDLGVSGEPLTDRHYRSLLQARDEGVVELMVHPVTSAAEMNGYTRVGAVGESEYRWLREGKLRELAAEEGFHLGNYRDLMQ